MTERGGAELNNQEEQRIGDAHDGEEPRTEGGQHLRGLEPGHCEVEGDVWQEDAEGDAGEDVNELGHSGAEPAPAPERASETATRGLHRWRGREIACFGSRHLALLLTVSSRGGPGDWLVTPSIWGAPLRASVPKAPKIQSLALHPQRGSRRLSGRLVSPPEADDRRPSGCDKDRVREDSLPTHKKKRTAPQSIGGTDGNRRVQARRSVPRRDRAHHRRVEPRVAGAGAGQEGRAQRAVRRPGRHRVR